jgi:hypothetical protein
MGAQPPPPPLSRASMIKEERNHPSLFLLSHYLLALAWITGELRLPPFVVLVVSLLPGTPPGVAPLPASARPPLARPRAPGGGPLARLPSAAPPPPPPPRGSTRCAALRVAAPCTRPLPRARRCSCAQPRRCCGVAPARVCLRHISRSSFAVSRTS